MSVALGPTRPDKLTIWPLDDRVFGIDVHWPAATAIVVRPSFVAFSQALESKHGSFQPPGVAAGSSE